MNLQYQKNKMPKKKVLFIINPKSGIGKHKLLESYINKALDKNRFEYDISYTKFAGQGTVLSKEAVDKAYDIVVASGGDGSVNEVARGLIGSKTLLGIIPVGSGNGLAHHLQIPVNLIQAIELINKTKTINIDTACINDKLFVSIAGIGFDALVAKKFTKVKRRGFLSYFKIIAKEYPKYKPQKYEINIDGKQFTRTALFISFANSDQFGYNTLIAPKAKIDDGMIDVCIVKKAPVIELPFLAHLLYWKQIDKSKFIETIKGKEIKIKQENKLIVNIDGDPVKLEKDIEVKINPLSLKIIVP